MGSALVKCSWLEIFLESENAKCVRTFNSCSDGTPLVHYLSFSTDCTLVKMHRVTVKLVLSGQPLPRGQSPENASLIFSGHLHYEARLPFTKHWRDLL